MSSLLERLNRIEVDRKGTLDPDDKAFCDRQDALYREAVDFLTDVKERMETIFASYEGQEDWNKDGYLSRHDDIYHVEQRLKEIRKRFIGRIVGYFANRYKVHLNTDQAVRDMEGKEATSAAILECIYVQLGGRSFTELAVQQIKDGLAGRTRYRKPEVKGCKVSFPQFVFPSQSISDTLYISYDGQRDLATMLRALQHFERGDLDISWPFTMPLQAAGDMWRGDPFRKFELGGAKVRAFRIYRNGKVEVTFATCQLAIEFVAEYARAAD